MYSVQTLSPAWFLLPVILREEHRLANSMELCMLARQAAFFPALSEDLGENW
jgi:hypothetical protein